MAKTTYILIPLFVLFQIDTLFGQQVSKIQINKINGQYTKMLSLPVNARLLTQNDDVFILHIDSISNGFFYGNQGKDSVSLSDVKVVNLRGPKEAVKYTLVTACAAITVASALFTIYAFNNTVATDYNTEMYPYVGMAYMATFATLGTVLYLYPKTRFPTKKYEFKME